jgi:two-component system sensor histidine kinase VicK
MAQIDASKIHLERQLVAVTEFIDRVLESFGPRLEERKLDLSLAENLPLVSADPDLASMALRQVIDNSLKYASPATRLQLAIETDTAGVTIRVRDQGPGIPEHERERIFERFFRQQSVKNRVPGSGLGLYIAREIMRAHGGDLWVESPLGYGSEFCLMLPKQEEKHKA